jgi:hypothetical protein
LESQSANFAIIQRRRSRISRKLSLKNGRVRSTPAISQRRKVLPLLRVSNNRVHSICKGIYVKIYRGGPNKFGASTKLDKSEPASNSASPAPTPRGSEVPTTPVDSRPPQTLSNNKAEGRQRTTKTDGISTSVLGDKVRDKCLEMVYDALACDSGARMSCLLPCVGVGF